MTPSFQLCSEPQFGPEWEARTRATRRELMRSALLEMDYEDDLVRSPAAMEQQLDYLMNEAPQPNTVEGSWAVALDKQLRDAALARTPTFFVARDHLLVHPEALGICGPDITFLQFGEDYLADPKMDPVGVYGNGAGNRRYLWRGSWYAEYPLHMEPLLQRTDRIGEIVREMREPCDAIKALAKLTPAAVVPQQVVWRALYHLRDDDETTYSTQTQKSAGEV